MTKTNYPCTTIPCFPLISGDLCVPSNAAQNRNWNKTCFHCFRPNQLLPHNNSHLHCWVRECQKSPLHTSNISFLLFYWNVSPSSSGHLPSRGESGVCLELIVLFVHKMSINLFYDLRLIQQQLLYIVSQVQVRIQTVDGTAPLSFSGKVPLSPFKFHIAWDKWMFTC